MKGKRKRLAAAAIAAIAALSGASLAGCGSSGNDANTMTVWVMAPLIPNYDNVLSVTKDDKQALFTKDVIETFERENNVKINLVHKGLGEELANNLSKVINTSQIGDVVYGETNLQRFYDTGKYSELIFSQAELENLIPQASKQMKSTDNGKIYSVPFYTGTLALSVNLSVLRMSGIIDESNAVINGKLLAYKPEINPLAPETWEDLLEICMEVRAYFVKQGYPKLGGMLLNNISGDSRWRALAFMRTAGDDFANENGKVDIDSPANVKALQMMRDLQATAPDGAVDTSNLDLNWNYFFSNKAAYVVDGADLLARQYKYPKLEMTVAELPVFEGVGIKSNLLCGTCYFSVPTAKDYEKSMKFIKYLLSDEVQRKLTGADCRIPVSKNILNEMLASDDVSDEMKVFVKPLADPAYQFEGAIPEFMNNSAQMWKCWDTCINTVLTNPSVSVADALKKAQRDMKEQEERV